MSGCEIRLSVPSSTAPAPSDPMDIDTEPSAAEGKSTEQPKPKFSPQAENNATEASPKVGERDRAAYGGAEKTETNDRGPSGGKKTKAQAKSKPRRKPPAKRAKKCNSTTEDQPQPRSISPLPSAPSSPKSTPSKQTASRHTGRQHAGAYTREEVHALQTWVNNSIKDDWGTIVQEVGKATGVHRTADSLRIFYGTVVLKEMYDSFPDKYGKQGTIVAADVGVSSGGEGEGVRKMCGDCGAILIEGIKGEEVKGTEELSPTRELTQVEAELTRKANGGLSTELPML